MIDLHLSAASEAELAAALPMLRIDDPDEGSRWVLSTPLHALDVEVAVFRDRTLVPGFHANLRLLDGHPERAAILDAASPYLVQPITPAQTFAGGVDETPVPAAISDRQFAQALADMDVISRAEALAFVRRGEMPADLQDAIDAIPDETERFAVNMEVSGATTFERDRSSTLALARALDWTPEQMDALWRRAASL